MGETVYDKAKFIYLAGLIDGEGSFIISRSNRGTYTNYYGRIHVKNTFYPLIEWLVQHFGGNTHPHKPKNPKRHSKGWSWYFSGDAHDKEKLLLALMPYLVVKKRQAKVLLEFFRMSGEVNPTRREELATQMNILNKRGPTVEINTQATEQDSVKMESELLGDQESALTTQSQHN